MAFVLLYERVAVLVQLAKEIPDSTAIRHRHVSGSGDLDGRALLASGQSVGKRRSQACWKRKPLSPSK